MSEKEQAVLLEVQRLPLTSRPFLDIAKRLGMEEKEIIELSKKFCQENKIRRFGISIAHRKIGFSSNLMTALRVPEENVDRIGFLVGSIAGVTHCYARKGSRYNLFFMIHDKSKSEGIKRVKKIVEIVGINDYKVYTSLKEFKKIPFEIPKDV